MGFFDKVFGGKTAGGSSPGDLGDVRAVEAREKGFSIAVPQAWTAVETPSGFESHPQGCDRIADPGSGREISSPGVTVVVSEITDPRQNAVKDTVRARSTEMPGHRMVKHVSGDVRKADYGIIYEYQYGPGEAPIRALGVIAQKKNTLYTVSACGTVQDFEKNRGTLEGIVSSFKLL